MNFAHRGILTALVLVVIRASINAYAPLGHEIVGAIADERLANTPTARKVYLLLDGLTLEKAAVIADEIKGWDSKGVDEPRSFHYSAHRNIDRQLRDFWRANQPTHDPNSPAPSHHWFHYTDLIRRAYPRTMSFTIPMFRWFRRSRIAQASPVAASGTFYT